MKIKIDKGIEIPTQQNRPGYAQALRDMKKGDSFSVEEECRNSIASVARTIGIKIITRSMGDNGTIRVWRVS